MKETHAKTALCSGTMKYWMEAHALCVQDVPRWVKFVWGVVLVNLGFVEAVKAANTQQLFRRLGCFNVSHVKRAKLAFIARVARTQS